MQKKFVINRTKIKGGCQLGSKVVPHDFKSDLPLRNWASFVSNFKYYWAFFWKLMYLFVSDQWASDHVKKVKLISRDWYKFQAMQNAPIFKIGNKTSSLSNFLEPFLSRYFCISFHGSSCNF